MNPHLPADGQQENCVTVPPCTRIAAQWADSWIAVMGMTSTGRISRCTQWMRMKRRISRRRVIEVSCDLYNSFVVERILARWGLQSRDESLYYEPPYNREPRVEPCRAVA